MCLEVRSNAKARKATRDIICYKILMYSDYYPEIVTPIKHYPMEIGKTYRKSGNEFRKFRYPLHSVRCKSRYIGPGGFNTYTKLKDALSMASYMSSTWPGGHHFLVVRCKILKDSFYIKSMSYFSHVTKDLIEEYCSKTLKLEKLIKVYK